MSGKTRDWLIFVAGAIVCVLCYWPSMHGELLWDDKHWLTDMALDPGNYTKIWLTLDMPDYWPITNTLYNVEYLLFEHDYIGWRTISLSLHLACCALLFIIARQWEIPGALIATLLFMLHPVDTATVAWITQQKTLLMTFFLAWSTIHLNLWLKGTRANLMPSEVGVCELVSGLGTVAGKEASPRRGSSMCREAPLMPLSPDRKMSLH